MTDHRQGWMNQNIADKNIHRMDSSDSDTVDLERNRQSMFIAVLVKRKKGNEEDRCSQVENSLDEGVNVNALDEDRNTVLHIAVQRGFEKVVKFLLGKGALTDIKNTQGDTVITLAEKLGNHEIARILKNSNESVHEPIPGAPQTQRSDNHGHDTRSFSSNQKCNADSELSELKFMGAPILASAHETQCTPCTRFEKNCSTKDRQSGENNKDISQLKRTIDRQSIFNAVPVKRKKGNEEDRSVSSNQKCNADSDLMNCIRAPILASAHEMRSTPGSCYEENNSTEDQPRNENEKDISQNPGWDTREPYGGSGLKNSLHGVTYQLKHLVLTLHHAWRKGYRFRLATELDSAEKFDDVVIEYEDSKGSRMHRFVQLKHRQDDSMQITAKELLKEDKGDFSVQKYFTSWRKVKNHEDFAESESKCFILCTNIGLNESKLNDEQIEVTSVDSDDFLKITDTEEQGSCYKLRANRNTKLYNKLKSASEVHRLASALAKCVVCNDSNVISLQRPDIVKRYYTALAREVFDVDVGKRKLKFTDAFIRNNGLSPRAEKFREIFFMYLQEFSSDKNSSESNLRTNLDKKSFTPYESSGKSTTGSQQNQLNDLPNDHITNFLDEFILAVDQPNELKLSQSVKCVFGEYSSFNLSNINFIGDSFQNFALDWFKAKQGVYLVREDIQEFLKEMKRKISSLITVGLSLHYPSELKKYDVQFKREVKGLRTFLDSSNSTKNLICQVISFEQTMLTALRIYQTLGQMEEYKTNDSFIFIKLKEFLLPEITRLVFLAFLSSGSQCLLAIDCGLDSTRQDMEQLRKIVSEIMTELQGDKITGKRIILILPEEVARVIQLEEVDKIYYEAERDLSIDNIKKATQQKLLSKKLIRFQGREEKTSFGELFRIINFDDVVEKDLSEYRQIMSPKTLVTLIQEKDLRIGEKSDGLGEIAKYYIPRTIDQRVVINVRVLIDPAITDVFAIGGIVAEAFEKILRDEKKAKEIGDRTAPNRVAQYIILEEHQKTKHFDILCRENSHLNIHWLQREHDQFIWMGSSRNSTNLLGYREETRRDGGDNDERGVIPLSEHQLAEYDEQRKIVILSDTAGMGKSTVLTRLAEKMRENEPCLLVIKIDLTDHTTVLASEERKRSFGNNDVKGAVDFLVDKLISNPEREDVLFFKTIIKVQRKVAILFDGFDEISPDYKETVIDLLQALSKLGVKRLFVTTRPHTSRALEEKLGAFSYTLLPFSATNQIEFLTQFWEIGSKDRNSDSCSSENRDRLRLQEHAQNVVELLSNSIDPSMKEFTGVPLQIRMVAEVFPFEKSPLPKRLAIVETYNKFVDKKYEVYCQEKKRDELTNLAVKSSSKRESKDFFRMHQRLALNLLFDETTVAKLLPTEDDDWDEIWEDMLKVGQQTGIVALRKDGQFRFIHRTFAEYFAATFLTKMLRNGRCNRAVQEFFVGQLFVQPEYRVIRAFSNCLLVAKNMPLEEESWEFDMSEHRNSEGDTAYHVAAEERHGGIATFLSNNVRERHGVPFSNINCPSTKYGKNTPLITAVGMTDNFDVVKCLIDAGADVNYRDSTGERKTALHVSVQIVDNVNVVSYLIDNQADMISRDSRDATPLHYAANSGRLDQVKYLAERGAGIDSQTSDGKTPLHLAARFGNPDLVKYLAEKGADINSQTENDDTPLHLAAQSGNLDLLNYLAERGANIHSQNKYGETPLHLAAQSGKLDLVKYFAERGVDIHSQTKYGETLLHLAAQSGNSDLVKYLAERGADIHSQTEDGETLLHLAAQSGNPDLVKYLLERGADINSQTKEGKTPLYLAAQSDNLDLVKYLAERGADIHSQTKDGRTPLHLAARFGNPDLVKYLAERGADIHSQTKDGITPLHLAAQFGKVDLVKYLAESGADINSQTKDGETPLYFAAQSGNSDLVKYLAERGADIHSRTKNCKTPLHLAALIGNLSLVEYLAERGVDIHSQNKDGETPLHLAARSGNPNLVKYLAARGAGGHSFSN